jgi:hypothetical protein
MRVVKLVSFTPVYLGRLKDTLRGRPETLPDQQVQYAVASLRKGSDRRDWATMM